MAVLLFLHTGGTVNSWLCFYFDDLDRVGSFALVNVCIRLPRRSRVCDGTQGRPNEAGGDEGNVLGGSCVRSSNMVVRAFVLQTWLYEHTNRWTATNITAYPRYLRWCGRPIARHDMGRTRRWIHHGFMSRFGNKLTIEEVIRVMEPTEEEMSLLLGEPQRKGQRVCEEAPEPSHVRNRARRAETGIGMSCRLSKRLPTGKSPDAASDARTKKMFRCLKRSMTVMKELERRVEELAAFAEGAKLEAGRMRDEAFCAREEALWAPDDSFQARDEASQFRDRTEGMNAEAEMAKVEACRMKDEAAACRDEAQRIYTDVAAAIDDHQNRESKKIHQN